MIMGNTLGTDASDSRPIPNRKGNVSFFHAPFNTVQGTGVRGHRRGGSSGQAHGPGGEGHRRSRGPFGLAVTFSDDLDVGRAQDLSNYTLVSAGRDRRDRHRRRCRHPAPHRGYNSATRTVSFLTTSGSARGRPMRLTINGTTETALTSASGFLIDGDANGPPGGNFVANVTGKTPLVRQSPAGRSPCAGGVSAAAFDALAGKGSDSCRNAPVLANTSPRV